MASVSCGAFTQQGLKLSSIQSPKAAATASRSVRIASPKAAFSPPRTRQLSHASLVGANQKLTTAFRGSRVGSAGLSGLRGGVKSGSRVNMAGITWNKELLFNIAIPLGGGLIASLIAAPKLKLYTSKLKKPSWAPPAPLFGNAWSIIYLTIGYAAWLVYRDGGGYAAQPGLWKLYGLQLILNWLWQPLFFNKQLLGVAFIDLAVLWGTIVALISKFGAVNTLAGKALIPYLAWVTFAGFLNWNLWQNNPAEDKDPQELQPKAA